MMVGGLFLGHAVYIRFSERAIGFLLFRLGLVVEESS